MLFLAAFAFISLQGRQPASSDHQSSADPITASAWRGLRLYGQTIPAEVDVRLRFGGDGRMQGTAGCNRVSGLYEHEGDRFRVESLRATRRGCSDEIMSVERNVFDMLRDARRSSLEGSELKLLDGEGEWLATFKAEALLSSAADTGS